MNDWELHITDGVNQQIGEILSREYARRLVPDETGGYIASIHEFPGCIAEGETADEAINNLEEAAASWVKVALSNGYEIREPVSFHGYSGKIALHIPRGLHKQVAELAELEGSSINQLLVTSIAQYLGSKCK
jgi:predicted RNase H-like HicB family nuclease